ncbi:LysR family transcriptional regulator [Aliagarivorans marinus]|uniref:LysR family transcriptional regulator n=1 Tax=Aliagarivorans marinus TaxID=561965 RepID=UPI0003FF0120|nr:LysR family transcriptional regulator [Aliagarivorans marinus]
MKNFDYNLLKVLRVLVDTQNTKQAAERLHLSQSAVSHALARLREAFDDPLFVRERYGLSPTERCLEITQALPDVVEQIDALFNPGSEFAAASYQGKIAISLSNALSGALGARLYARLRHKAPNARFEIMDWTWQVETALLSRQIHLALDYGPESYSKQIKQQRMPQNHYILCVRKGHPITKLKHYDVTTLARYPLVLIRTPDWRTRHETAEETFIKAGLVPEVLLKSDSPEVNFAALRSSDAIFPTAISLQSLPDDIVALPPGEHLPEQNMDIYAYYPYQTQDNALVKWLISEVRALFEEES